MRYGFGVDLGGTTVSSGAFGFVTCCSARGEQALGELIYSR